MVLVKYRLGELIRILGMDRYLPFHWVPPGMPWHKDNYTRSERTRMAMEELGTTFIKVGQILSTRSDVVPSEYSQELSKLQNCLLPLPVDVIEKTISEELGRPVREIFQSFDPEPVGVASIGQVHSAKLQDGTEVVVKIRKLGVVERVTEDMDILRQLAQNSAENGTYYYQYNLVALVEEISDTMKAELDYVREGHNAEHFAKFFQDDPSIHIPRIFWQYTTTRVIVLERIQGIGILDLPALDKAGFDRKQLAKRAVNIWLKMVFEDNIFHADPHPGNLFVEADGRLGLIDFGMVGQVDAGVRDYLASAVKAILDRDVDLLVDSITDLGAVAPDSSKDSLRADLKHVMSHYSPGEEYHLVSNLGELVNAVRRNRVQLPANTFLLLKTLSMAQAIGRGLNPDFDFFEEILPHVEATMKKRYAPSSLLSRLPATAADLALFGIDLPKRLMRLFRSLERGEVRFRSDVSDLDLHMEHLERLVNRAIIGIVASAVLLAIAIIILAYRWGG
jgi:ubiquinone biosynthesis protein